MSGPVQVKRDPFGRRALMRLAVNPGAGIGCTECGNMNGRGRLFIYWWEDDGSARRAPGATKPFCSIKCWRDYQCYGEV